MSALTPHIRVLQVLAASFELEAKMKREPDCHCLMSCSRAIKRAAEDLEKADREQALPMNDPPITYDPKGKR